jgi:hypothetical protein
VVLFAFAHSSILKAQRSALSSVICRDYIEREVREPEGQSSVGSRGLKVLEMPYYIDSFVGFAGPIK